MIDPAEAEGELREIYRRIAGARGGVADIHKVQSLNPRALAAHFELYKAIMFQASPLSRAQREALAVVVSRANGCHYCAAHHSAALAQLRDAGPPLDDRLRDWAQRLARTPEASAPRDLEVLRDAGLDDRAILDAILTVAYFSYVNRLVLATGLRLEADYEQTCRPTLE
jgi:AhpD family alkylhydroperoxidase